MNNSNLNEIEKCPHDLCFSLFFFQATFADDLLKLDLNLKSLLDKNATPIFDVLRHGQHELQAILNQATAKGIDLRIVQKYVPSVRQLQSTLAKCLARIADAQHGPIACANELKTHIDQLLRTFKLRIGL